MEIILFYINYGTNFYLQLNWNRTIIFGETNMSKCVKRLMTATLSKAIEMEYSAFGRQIHGVGKKDFSKTQMYACLNG